MIPPASALPGEFCWLDLAAADAPRAKTFYGELFGWRPTEQRANGGTFSLLRLRGEDVGSLYQLDRAHLEHGVPSHWTPYVRVADVGEAARRAVRLGGSVLAGPLVVPGFAQVALVLDPIGARIGLWQSSGAAPAP